MTHADRKRRLRREGPAAPPDDGHLGSFTFPDDTVLVEGPGAEHEPHPDTNQRPLPERHGRERREKRRRR